LRITGGTHKGRIIKPPRNIKTRPTTDKAREGLFNILQNSISIEEHTILDLFCGTGAISFEFASREAKHIQAVEIDPKLFNYLKKTIIDLDFDMMRVIRTDVFRFVAKCNEKYDIIFADPPYTMNRIKELPDLIFQNKLLNENGIFILEHSDVNSFENHANFKRLKKYGNVHFSFFS
jgi:16S rRNA (guanine(966)-N(2))-methyltransferase RsmD